jgi:hypothetical protein
MKKLYTLFSFVLLSSAIMAQDVVFSSSFEEWTGDEPADLPVGWGGDARTNLPAADITQNDDAQEGEYSVKLVRDNSGHQRFASSAVTIEASTEYTYTFWIKGTGDIRIGLFDGGYAPYSAYVSANATWTQHTFSVVAQNATEEGNFIFSLRNTGSAGLLLDNVEITTGEVAPPELVSIYDIQFTTVPGSGNTYPSLFLNQVVTTTGVVTAVVPNANNPSVNSAFYLQDGEGAWNGIYVFNPNNTFEVGNEIEITATVEERFGNTQLAFVSNSTIINEQASLPTATVITTGQANSEEAWEGVLVTVDMAECTNASAAFGLWLVNDGSGVLEIGNSMHMAVRANNNFYKITGPILYTFDDYQLQPRGAVDVVNLGTVNISEIAANDVFGLYPNPSSGLVNINLMQANNPRIEIANVVGQLVYQNEPSVNQGVFQVDLAQFNSGIYLVSVISEGKRFTQKLIVTE